MMNYWRLDKPDNIYWSLANSTMNPVIINGLNGYMSEPFDATYVTDGL
jgi:hypothetical protein